MSTLPVDVQANGSFGGFTPASFAVAYGPYGVAQTSDITLSLNVNAITTLNDVVSNYIGDVTVIPVIESSIESIKTIVGDINAVALVASSITEINYFVSGVTVTITPNSIVSFKEVRQLISETALYFSVGSSFEFDPYAGIDPIIHDKYGSIDASVDINTGSIDTTIDNDTGSIGATP